MAWIQHQHRIIVWIYMKVKVGKDRGIVALECLNTFRSALACANQSGTGLPTPWYLSVGWLFRWCKRSLKKWIDSFWSWLNRPCQPQLLDISTFDVVTSRVLWSRLPNWLLRLFWLALSKVNLDLRAQNQLAFCNVLKEDGMQGSFQQTLSAQMKLDVFLISYASGVCA